MTPERFLGRITYEIRMLTFCFVQEVPENGGDLSHFNAVHKEAMLNGSDLRFQYKNLFQFLKHHWRAEWDPCKDEGFKHIGLCKLTHKMILFDKFIVSPCNIDIQQVRTSENLVDFYL